MIEYSGADKRFRRQRVAKKLFEDLWLKVESSWPGCRFAMLWATHLNNTEDSLKMEDMPAMERDQYYQFSVASVVSFWRAKDSRRIGTTQ